MIPIFGEFIEWLVWMPLVLFMLWRTILKDYPGAVSLWVWNKEKPVWSLLWTVLFGVLLIIPVSNIPYDITYRNPFEPLDTCLWAVLFLNVRAIIVARPAVILANIPRFAVGKP